MFVNIAFLLGTLLFLCVCGYLIVKIFNIQGESEITEEETVRAIGLRGLGHVTKDSNRALNFDRGQERAKKLVSFQSNQSYGTYQIKVIDKKEKTQELSRASLEASKELLNITQRLLSDIKNRTQFFETIQADILYLSSKDLASNLIFAGRLISALEKRAELIQMELSSEVPNYQKAYEIGTASLELSTDSMNTLISDKNMEPIKWTTLPSMVKDLIGKLDSAIDEYNRKRHNKSKFA